MNNIIDVEFKKVMDLEDKSTEELRQMANFYWEQMELLGKLGFEFAAKAGQHLKIIKSRLKHGEWEDWAKDNLCFSLRKANYMMKLADELGDENSLFFKNANVADIGISKVWALLGAPEEVRETVMENPDIMEMSAREFKDEIKRLKEESKEKDTQLDKAAETVLSMKEKVAELENVISGLERELDETVPENTEELEKVKADLQTAKDKLAKEKDNRKKDKEKTNQLIEAAKAEAEENAREKIEAENRNKMESLQLQLEDSQKTIAGLKDKLENNQQTEVTIFKVNFDRLQTDFNSCMQSIQNVNGQNPEQAAKMKTALMSAMNALMGRIG